MNPGFAHIKSMEINKLTLNFIDKDKERKFRKYYFKNSHVATRISFVLVALLYSIFGYLDYLMAGEQMVFFWQLRFLLVVPILLMTFFLSFLKNFESYWQELMFVSYLIAAGTIVIMIVSLPNDFVYSNGMLLIFFAGYVFIKLRFLLATLAGWLSLLFYNILALYNGHIESSTILVNDFFFVAANFIGMFAAYNSEVFDRRNFYLYLQIAQKNKDIEFINKNLEKTVERRTKLLNMRNEELHNEIARRITIEQELIKAKEKAEESDKLKSAFLTNMSHEIRTPMNGIIGFAELLREAEDEQEMNEFIDIIVKNGQHLLDLINDIIDLSKIEAGVLQIFKSEFNLNELTGEIYKLFSANKLLVEKNLQLSYHNHLPDDEANIITDRTRLKQILINLINNAVKYTEKGSIEFYYTLENDVLEFFVKDTGIGIAEEHQEHLFERFMQVTLNNTPKKEGTGLGLAITKTYLKMMGGNIKVRSQLNVGSTFSFTLPVSHVRKDLKQKEEQHEL